MTNNEKNEDLNEKEEKEKSPEVPEESPEKIAAEETIEKIDKRLETLEETGKRFQDEAERSPILAPEEKAEAETTVKETREEGQKTAEAAKTKIQETQEEAAAETITDIPKRIAEIEEELQKEQSEKRPIQANALKAKKEYLERQLSIQEDEKRIEKMKGEIGKRPGITDKIADRFVKGTIKEMERKKEIKENEQKIYEIRKEIADVSSKIRNEEQGEEQITKLRNERKDLETAINQTEGAKTRLEKIEGVLTNKELGKQFLKTAAESTASAVGVKSFYDVPAYFKQRFMVKGMFGKGKGMSGSMEELLGASWESKKAMKEQGEEYESQRDVQKAIDDLNKRIKQTKEGSEKGSEQRNKLAQILKENRLREKTEKEERKKEIKTILDDYTTTKITGIQAAKESLNTFLMASGAYALRGVSYGLMDGIGRYQNLQKEGKKQGKKVKVFKDVIVKSIENTFKEAVFIDDKSKETTKLQKGLTAIKAWGKIARYAGIGAMMGLHPQAGGDAIDKALDAFSGKATLGDVANNFKYNTERIALVYGKAIKSLGQPLGLLTGEAQGQTMPPPSATITDYRAGKLIFDKQPSSQTQIIPQGLTEPKIDYQRGHSIWEEAHNRLLKLNEFRQLGRPIKELVDFKTSEALQTYNIDRVENLITQNPVKYGLPENIDFTKMSDKQIANINWEQAFKDAFGEKPVLTSQLTPSQIENIVKNNEALRTYFQTHSNIPRTQENIAAILKGRVLPGAEEKITEATTKQIADITKEPTETPSQAPEELPGAEEPASITEEPFPTKKPFQPIEEITEKPERVEKIPELFVGVTEKPIQTTEETTPIDQSQPYNPLHPEEVIVPLSKEPMSRETAGAWEEIEKETRRMQEESLGQRQKTTPPKEAISEATPQETISEEIIPNEKEYFETISKEVADYLKIHSAELPPDIKKGQSLAETIKSINEQIKTVQADIRATAVNPAFLTKDKTNANLSLIQEIENKLTGQKPGQELDQEATKHLKLVINEGLAKDFNIPPDKLTNWQELQKIARQNPEDWDRNQLLQYKMLLLQKRTIQDYLKDFLNLSNKVKSFKGILSPDQGAIGAGLNDKETPQPPLGG